MTQERNRTYYYLVQLSSHMRYTYHSFRRYNLNDVVMLPNVHSDRLPIKGRIVANATPMERTKPILAFCPIDNCAFKELNDLCMYTNDPCTHPNPKCKHWGINDVA